MPHKILISALVVKVFRGILQKNETILQILGYSL